MNTTLMKRLRLAPLLVWSLPILLGSGKCLAQGGKILFDDFNYETQSELTSNGWNIRQYGGAPGLSNSGWSANNISFVHTGTNKSMRLKTSTNINGSNIAGNVSTSGTNSQSEVSRDELEYLNGTWATRMYFTDVPSQGPDGDTVIQTFFGLTKYIENSEPYSEIDFEYLPNGGWYSDSSEPSMWSGTYRIVDFSNPANHGATRTPGSLQGWNDLVMQVKDNDIKFYINGVYQTGFTGTVAPDYPMYLMFQIWFSNDCFNSDCTQRGYINNSKYREYYEDIDWVYFEKDTILSTTEVLNNVERLRSSGHFYFKGQKLDAGISNVFKVEAEEYINAYDTTQGNFGGAYRSGNVDLEIANDVNGGYNLGWTANGEWLDYSIDLPVGYYVINSRVASDIGGASFGVTLGGETIGGTQFVENTGGWQNWITSRSNSFYHPGGQQNLRVDVYSGGFNLNWIAFEAVDPSASDQQCNWWDTYYPLCTHINSGWGWQNNTDCIGWMTCATLSPPSGIVNK